MRGCIVRAFYIDADFRFHLLRRCYSDAVLSLFGDPQPGSFTRDAS